MKNVILFAGLVVVFASCSPASQIARNKRYYKRKELNASGPMFPGTRPCCISCAQVSF